MHDKRDDRKNRCYHGGPRSEVVIPQYVSENSQGLFLPLCYLRFHQGIVIDADRRICERRECENYSKALPDAVTEELKRCARKIKNGRHHKPETIQFPECIDNISQFFPYCTNPDRMGLIYWDKYPKCEKECCKFYIKFRPPAGHRRKQRKPLVLKCLQDLNPLMLR